MFDMPDLATATRDVARWELEFALDPDASAVEYSSALNILAIRQNTSDMPDAAVASWIKAAEVARHPGIADRAEARDVEMCALFNMLPALLDLDQPEQALGFAERMIALDVEASAAASSRAMSIEFKAQCLRRLGRTDEELSALLDAMGLFALAEDSAETPDFSEVTTTHTARRIAQILEEERPG